MSQPKAIYASVAPFDSVGPEWVGTQPVVVANPFPFWPNLDWTGDNIGQAPTTRFTEIPQYLWFQPVADPVNTTTGTFIRKWVITAQNTGFTPRTIEQRPYNIVITIAADDQYTMELRNNGVLQQPTGVNTNVPESFPWRNVKTYVYEDQFLHQTTTLTLTTVATNIGQGPDGTPSSNPAMFTWVMQLFAQPNPS